MGLIREWISEMGDVWDRMAQGDAGAFIGIPETGTSHCSTPDGGTLSTPDGSVWGTPDGNVLSEAQLISLIEFYKKGCGNYPHTGIEFQQWIRVNW